MAKLQRDPNYRPWRDLSLKERQLRKWMESGRPRWLWISKRIHPNGQVSGQGTMFVWPEADYMKLEKHDRRLA